MQQLVTPPTPERRSSNYSFSCLEILLFLHIVHLLTAGDLLFLLDIGSFRNGSHSQCDVLFSGMIVGGVFGQTIFLALEDVMRVIEHLVRCR